MDDTDCVIVDNRSREEFVGTDRRARHGAAIPGAKHRDWEDLYDHDSGCMKSADQTVVTYDDIVAQLERQQKTLDRMLKWMSAGAALFALWGWYTIRWNRRHYPPPTA